MKTFHQGTEGQPEASTVQKDFSEPNSRNADAEDPVVEEHESESPLFSSQQNNTLDLCTIPSFQKDEDKKVIGYFGTCTNDSRASSARHGTHL